MRILVVEDDCQVARMLQIGLQAELFAVDVAHNGHQALELSQETDYDLITLDLILPDLDGFTVLKRLRKNGAVAPILILTARSAVSDRVRGLESGADDYLVKPFSFEELLARIRALLRRPVTFRDRLCAADLEIDGVRHQVMRRGKPIHLTPKEYAVLDYLVRNAGRPVSRTKVVEHVWNDGFDGLTNIVDVYINRLRVKIDGDSPMRLIRTVRGIGYVLGESYAEEEVA